MRKRCANSSWIDSVQPQLHRKISLLLDEIPLSNQSQLNQTYFITQLHIRLPKSKIRQGRSKSSGKLTIVENKEILKGTGSHIDQSDCIHSLSNHLFSRLPPLLISLDGKQFDPRNFQSSDHKLHTKERVYPIIIFLVYSFHEYFTSIFDARFFFNYNKFLPLLCKYCVNTVIFILFVYYLLFESLQFDMKWIKLKGKFLSFDQFFDKWGKNIE